MIGTLKDEAFKDKDFKNKNPKDKAFKTFKIILFRMGWEKYTPICYYGLYY